MWPNPQFPADLVTFTEEILNEKLHLLCSEYFSYDFKKSTNLGKLYLLPKSHRRLYNIPGRPVISNCGTPTEEPSEFLGFHLKP